MGLNKAFCGEEGGEQVGCSQDLFESSDVFVGEKECETVRSVPDSPMVGGASKMLEQRDECAVVQQESVLSSPPLDGERAEMAAEERGEENKEVRIEGNREIESSVAVCEKESAVSHPLTLCDTAHHPVQLKSVTNRVRSNPNSFLYPSSRHLSGIQQRGASGGKRKRTGDSLGSPPERKKVSLASSVTGEPDTEPMTVPSPETELLECLATADSDTVLTEGVCEVKNGNTEQLASAPETGTKRSCVAEISASEREGLPPSPPQQPSHLPLTETTPPVPGPTDPPLVPPPLAGFKTASGLSISVSAGGLERARQLMKEAEDDSTNKDVTAAIETPQPPLTGFKTASGHSFSISVKSLESACRLLSEDGDAGTTPTPVRPIPEPQSLSATTQHTPLLTPVASGPLGRRPLTTQSTGRLRSRAKPFRAPRPAGSVSKAEEEAKVARLLHGMRRAGAGVATHHQPPDVTESGFSTGGGRKLSVSASSLQRAQQLVTEDKENGIAAPPVAGPRAVSTVSCTGFQAASGRGVTVSASALERARSLFAGIASESGPEGPESGSPVDEEQQSQSFYTGELDLADFATFTQLPRSEHSAGGGSEGGEEAPGESGGERGEAPGESGGERGKAPGESGGEGGKAPGESEGGKGDCDEDCSAYFSTQAVKRFLNYTADTDSEEEMDISQQSPSTSSSQTSSQSATTSDRTLCPTDAAATGSSTTTRDKPSSSENMVQSGGTCEAVDEYSCGTSALLMDELFGAVSVEASPQTQTEVEGEVRPDGEVEGEARPDGEVEDEARPNGEVEGEARPDGEVEGEARPDGEVEDEARPDGEVEGEARPDGEVEAGLDCSEEVCSGLSASVVERLTTIEEEASASQDREVESRAGTDRTTVVVEQEGPEAAEKSVSEDAGEEAVVESASSVCNEGEREKYGIIEQPVTEKESPVKKMEPPSFPGLMTASGKKIEVSTSALSAARAALSSTPLPPATATSDDDGRQRPREDSSPPPAGSVSRSFPGLQTAGGKKVEISEAALRAVRHEVCSTAGGKETVFPGLLTAGGKKVEISEAALRAVRHEVCSTAGGKETVFPGLLTAGGKKVEISEAALRAVRHEVCSTAGGKETVFPGLLTAGGKKVEISEAALRAVRHEVCSTAGGKETVFPGLLTAGGKRVEISESSLAAVRGGGGISTAHPSAIVGGGGREGTRSSGETVTPQFRPLATNRALSQATPTSSSIVRRSVRYRPVFRSEPRPQPLAPPPAPPINQARSVPRHDGVRSTPEGDLFVM